jgi:acetyltransferase
MAQHRLFDWRHRACLQDGRCVLVRLAAAGDEASIQEFVSRLSPESRYQRFFLALRELPQPLLERMISADVGSAAALLAMAYDFRGSASVVGLAQYAKNDGSDSADVAVVVGERWRHVGLAVHLLTDLSVVAAAFDVAQAEADILRNNGAALHLAGKLGCKVSSGFGSSYLVHVSKKLTMPHSPSAAPT